MKYVIVAGGTAGHINPSLALGQELVDRGHQVLFVGTPNRLESTLVPQAGFDFVSFEAYGFNRKKPLTLIKSLNSINKSTNGAIKLLKEYGPNAVIGFGCYVSLAVCRAALKLNIPVVIHEQNSVMGLANKYLSSRVNAVCLTYSHADNKKCKHCEITGNPVRKSVIEANAEDGKNMLNISKNRRVLTVFGGSLGADHLNKAIVNLAGDIFVDTKFPDIEIVHITGQRDYENVLGYLPENLLSNSRYHVMAYQSEMGKTLAASDFVISRSGASSLAEIAALKIPALLIPYPLATKNHQYYNAADMVKQGCAMLIDDRALSTPDFKNAVLSLIGDDDLYASMKNQLELLDASNAVVKVADIVEKESK